MHYTTLGTTDLRVSRLCLGSMTWGEQNSEAEAHAQLDRAFAAGVNFIDTAEIWRPMRRVESPTLLPNISLPPRPTTSRNNESRVQSSLLGGLWTRSRRNVYCLMPTTFSRNFVIRSLQGPRIPLLVLCVKWVSKASFNRRTCVSHPRR